VELRVRKRFVANRQGYTNAAICGKILKEGTVKKKLILRLSEVFESLDPGVLE